MPLLRLLLAATAAVVTTAANAEDRPNILFVTADDLGLQLSCYGDPHITTPHLDKLAAAGARFDVAYVAQASCSPSRSAMFTGLFPHTNGQLGLTNSGNFTMKPGMVERSVPALLKRAGYRTGIIGKLHVNPEKQFPFDSRARVNTRKVADVAEAAASFIGDDENAAPFFLMVNYSDPHAYRENRKSRNWHFPAQVDGIPADPIPENTVPGWPFQGIDTPLTRKRVSNYYNTVKRLDHGVGLLLAELDRRDLADNTLVLFVGDHGPPFNRAKTTCYEAGLRVPFIVRWPGTAKPGNAPDAMVSTVDILPTFLDAVGIDKPADLHGRSLAPLLTGQDTAWRETLYAEFHYHGAHPFFPRRAVRDGRYKLIHNLLAGTTRPPAGIDGDPTHRIAETSAAAGRGARARIAYATFKNPPEFELYDLQSDPHEFDNLATDPAHAGALEQLKQALHRWRTTTADPFLDPEAINRERTTPRR